MVALAAVLGGCDELIGPAADRMVAESELTFIEVAPGAPDLAAMEVSFWVVRGEEREVEIRYETPVGYNGKCLRFVVPAEAPLRHPDGRPIAPGDSARVTIRVVDPRLFIFEFDPAGLRFDPSHPARLEIRYRWADLDVNDEQLVSRLGIWRQERPGDPWSRVETVVAGTLLEVHASITGFTRYALASDRSGFRTDS